MIFANAVILSVSCWKEQDSHVALSRLADCPELSLCLGIDIPETHLSSKTGQDFLSSSLISHVFSAFLLVLEAGSKKKKKKRNVVRNLLLLHSCNFLPPRRSCT